MFTLFFIGGILLSEINTGYFTVIFILISLGVLLLSIRIIPDNRGTAYLKKINILRTGIIFVSLLFLTAGYARAREESDNAFYCEKFDRGIKNVIVCGTVADISLASDGFQLITRNNDISIPSDDIGFENRLNDIEGIIVYSDFLPDGLLTGDIIEIPGTLSPCSEATNEGQFDACKYYALKNIQAKLYSEEITIKEKKQDNISGKVDNCLFNIRNTFVNGIKSVLPEREAGIMCAMLAGERSYLDEEIKDIYSQAGLAHVLSISGLHISLLGMGLYEILMKLSGRLKFSVVTTVLVMFLYGILTGFSISTERAFIMLACMLPARIIGRVYDGQSAAFLAALIILFSQPGYLYDSGFQMSFCAVFGIFAGNMIRQELKISNRLLLWILPCISAQAAVFPILLKSYFYFSTYSILINSLLIPLMSVIIIMGILAGIAASVSIVSGLSFFMFPAAVAAGPDYYLLKLFEEAGNLVTALPDSMIITGAPDTGRIIVYYVIFFLVVYLITGRKIFTSDETKRRIIQEKQLRRGRTGKKLIRKIRLFFAGSAVCLLCICFIRFDDEAFNCTFLDVGQGLCMHISKGDINLLVDGGSTSKQSAGKYIIKPYLLYNGVRRLDYCIVTHTDSDHVNGLKELINDGMIDIGTIAVSTQVEDTDPLVQLADENGIPVLFLGLGDSLELDGIRLDFISPDPETVYTDDNSASLVFCMKEKDFEVLVTGDSGFESENLYPSVLKETNIVPEILQVPHHGSKYSSSSEMLETVRPAVSVISCSKYNSYGHPAPVTLERLNDIGSSILTTYDYGMIRFRYF